MPRRQDPIETAREELKQQREAEEHQDAAPAGEDVPEVDLQRYLVPGVHPMRTFKGTDGRDYARRADITMAEWRAYAESVFLNDDDFFYWVALFTGRLHRDSLGLPWEAQHQLGLLVFDGTYTDDYFSMRAALFESITNPAGPKGERPS